VDRRAFLGSLTGGLLAAPLASEAQQAVRVYRIGYLSPDSGPSRYSEALRQGLRDLGWVEGEDIAIEYRWAGQKRDRLPDLARELVRHRVDLIFAPSVQGAFAAKRATKTIPIVIPVATDPVGSGLVKSLAQPGENLTGFAFLSEELVAKRFELLKEVAPETTLVAVLVNPTHPAAKVELREGERVARLLRLQVQAFEARDPTQLASALAEMAQQRAYALLPVSDRLFVTERKTIAEFAARHRVPVIHFATEFVADGGLMAYGPNITALYRRAATLVDKILKGAKPGDLPVEQPTKFELAINLKTAKALGLTIPPAVLARADEVIE
jgi:putative ABC transport system substrate-binding protein